MTQLWFEVTNPDAEPRRVKVEHSGPAWIGRDAACELVLDSPNVSRRHVNLQATATGITVSDMSANGTLVDAVPIRRTTHLVPRRTCNLTIGPFVVSVRGTEPDPPPRSPTARREMHRELLAHLDLPNLDRTTMDPETLRPRVLAALRRIVARHQPDAAHEPREALVLELCNEALGLGPLEHLLTDADVSEIMVVDPHTIYAERSGRIERTGLRFTDDDTVRATIERIVAPLGRRIDESTPLVDARLPDGSRVNAVIPPLAVRGPCITIRKFAKSPLGLSDLVRFESLSERMARFLERSVRARRNIVISGGTGSGKTTLLNALSSAIPEGERIVTAEDAAELQLAQPHVVSLESRPPNLEGKGAYTIRDLVRNALRMRPDRIVVGECRGGEAIDMLQAMNTGHDGSMTTTHANSPAEAVARIETLCLMSGLDLPASAIRRQIASSVHLILQQTRFSDGSRRITSIAEITGLGDSGDVELSEIYRFRKTGLGAGGRLEGEFIATGYLPTFLSEFIALGLIGEEADCL